MFVNITINVYKCVVRIPVLRFLKKGFGRIQSAGDLWGNFQKITVKIHSFKKGPNPPRGGRARGELQTQLLSISLSEENIYLQRTYTCVVNYLR